MRLNLINIHKKTFIQKNLTKTQTTKIKNELKTKSEHTQKIKHDETTFFQYHTLRKIMKNTTTEKGTLLLLKSSAIFSISLLTLFFITLIYQAWPSLKTLGASFYISDIWNPLTERFGALPFLFGTLITSIMAVLIALPVALSLAILLGVYIKKGILHTLFSTTLELLAGIPSVIYGFWALFILVPIVRNMAISMNAAPYGVSILAASIILAIMIIPYAASFGREIIKMVPKELTEAGIALGATRYEIIKHIILPYAKSGIFSGFLLAFSRALGETMAVTMVVGNANRIPSSLFEPGNTIASIIANEFAEATNDFYISALMQLGLLLMIVTITINFIGQVIIKKWKITKN